MFQEITNWALGFQFNSLLGILLYWLPVLICVIGYTLRTFKNYSEDKIAREQGVGMGKYYRPTDTIGTLIGRALVSIIPIANLWAASFDISPKILSRFFEFIGKVFDQPLVPDNEHYEQIRKEKCEIK